jgi:Tol biopolymer transport system component
VNDQRDIYVMNPDGSFSTQLTTNPADDLDPEWSPDGAKIAFTSRRDDEKGDIFVMNADGSRKIRLTKTTGVDQDPSWSPDGARIIFISDRAKGYNFFVMDADGGNVVQLTNNMFSNHRADWSPDGSSITYYCARSSDVWDIYSMSAMGGGCQRLTTDEATDKRPKFSPDGQKILFDSNRYDTTSIYVMNADGSGEKRVTIRGGSYGSWTNDGRILFHTFVDNVARIAVMDADGDNYTVLTGDDMSRYNPDQMPDGSNDVTIEIPTLIPATTIKWNNEGWKSSSHIELSGSVCNTHDSYTMVNVGIEAVLLDEDGKELKVIKETIGSGTLAPGATASYNVKIPFTGETKTYTRTLVYDWQPPSGG